MPDFTVIEGRENVIDLDKRLDADLDGSEESKILAAIKEIRGEDINAVVAAYIDANAASVDTLINAAKSR